MIHCSDQPLEIPHLLGHGYASMLDEVSNLFSVSIYVESMLGLLLLYMWVQNFEIRAVAWWGSAHLLRAGSISLFGLYGQVHDLITIDLSNVILLTSFATTWIGTRLYAGRKMNPPTRTRRLLPSL